MWHKATIQDGLDSGAAEVTDDDLSDMPKPTDSCWWVLVFWRLRFDAFVREGDIMNGEKEKKRSLLEGAASSVGWKIKWSNMLLLKCLLVRICLSDRNKIYVCLLIILSFVVFLMPITTYSLPGPHTIYRNRFVYDIGEILNKYNIHIDQKWLGDASSRKKQPWLNPGGKGCWWGGNCVEIYRADEIPQEAKLEIIKYCIDMYEKRGRKEKFKVSMFFGAMPNNRSLLFGPKPYMQLTIDRSK